MARLRIGKYYVLRGHEVVEVDSFVEAAGCFENTAARTVAKTQIVSPDGTQDSEVSTVFLTIDHNFSNDGPPILFETMVFGNEAFEGLQRRYTTWGEAEAGHEAVVATVRLELEPGGAQKPVEVEVTTPQSDRRTWHEHVLKEDDDGS